jgi:uncharacterized protein involved in response to NO
MLIGGRIVPSFTRNWLAQRGGARLPVPFNRFDAVAIALGVGALLSWVVAPFSPTCAALSLLAALLHAVRLLRWQGHATWRSPLLLMLHVAYLFVPLGFLGVGASAAGWAAPATGAHLFGIGAIAGMTTAVMMRATLGHTGRPLVSDAVLTSAFALIVLAAVARLAGSLPILPGTDGTSMATLLWTAAFVLLVWRIAPWLARPKQSRRMPTRSNAGS